MHIVRVCNTPNFDRVIALQRLFKHDFISSPPRRTAARLQYTKFSYTLKVTVHKIFILIYADNTVYPGVFIKLLWLRVGLQFVKYHIKHSLLLNTFSFPPVARHHAVSAKLLFSFVDGVSWKMWSKRMHISVYLSS